MYDAPALFHWDESSRSPRPLKIVLFGATGNLGRRIAKEALDRGNEVVGVVRNPARTKSHDDRLTLVQGDATEPASVRRVARGADVVVSAISPCPDSDGVPPSCLAPAARALIGGTRDAGVMQLIVVGSSTVVEDYAVAIVDELGRDSAGPDEDRSSRSAGS